MLIFTSVRADGFLCRSRRTACLRLIRRGLRRLFTLCACRKIFWFLEVARWLSRKQDGGEIEYRFELRKDDLPAYIVAGRYADSSSRGKSADKTDVAFWTLQPLQQDPAAAAQRIAAAWSTLQKDFGPLDKNIPGPHVVESPELRARAGDEGQAAAASFPGGALVNSARWRWDFRAMK